MSSRSFFVRFSAFNAFLFLGTGIQMPFLPLWLRSEGLSDSQISLIVAAMVAIRIFAMPLGTYLADLTGNRRRVIMLSTLASFICYGLLYFVDGFLGLLVMAVLAAALFAPVGPLIEVFAIEGSAHYGIDYGRIRLWASLSFLSGSLLSGLLLEFVPVSAVILLIAGAQGIGALATLLLPPDHGIVKPKTSQIRFSAVLFCVLAASFLIFAAASSIGQASHGLFYSMGSVYFSDLGYSEFTIGKLWAVAVISEIVMFAFSNRIHKRFGSVNLMALEPPLAIMYLAQTLHAGSFGLTHLGTMHYIRETVPDGMRNTVKGLYSALSGGILLSASMWAAGPLYGALGGQAYWVMAACAAIALVLALILARISPRAS
jgi:MFS transporter, PPP family, 3-phenylpropionic acid transporter